MGKINRFLLALILLHFILIPSVCLADESAVFTTSADPDVLIVLDLSGSMQEPPAGYVLYSGTSSCNSPYYGAYGTGHTHACSRWVSDGYFTYCSEANDTACEGPFYDCSGNPCLCSNTAHTKDCSKLATAKAAIKKILDANGDGNITSPLDDNRLRIRIGYMRFSNCASNGSNLDSCIIVAKEIGTPYSEIWDAVNAEHAGGNTPDALTLSKAKTYLDAHKAADPSKDCRKKSVILITDGLDNLSCSDYTEGTPWGRRVVVGRAKALKDAGYNVFVIGFGATMVEELKRTLEWAAYFGGTDNPSQPNSGNTNALSLPDNLGISNLCNDNLSPRNQAPDPAAFPLSGYAYLATNATEMTQALQQSIRIISDSRYSFSLASVSATRVASENFIYGASFKPAGNDPFWPGFLKKYNLNSDGSIGSLVWDAGAVLQSRALPRNIFSLIGGLKKDFDNSWGSWKDYLGVDTDSAKDIMDYIRGDSAKNPDNWKLGDMFHSNPIAVGSPSYYYIDALSPDAFATFRESNKTRERIIVMGSNDGQFRAFSAGDGSEKWSFIPPNLLPKLQYIAHPTHPTALQHTYFVDGPVVAADVWLGSGDGKSKVANDWHTLLVFSEGRGVRDSTNTTANYLWSKSSKCDGTPANFNKIYTSGTGGYQYYCGYWAFDLTDTSATTHAFKWLLQPNATQAPYLGEPWSKMALGRVKINGNEKWVGFIGGGYNAEPSNDPNGGKGFFVVDLSSGSILWSYTKGIDANMTYSIPASPAIVDMDSDGFVDTVYIGDLGGNVWRFKFCTDADGSTCDTPNWTGGKFFQSSTATPIYTTPSVARASGSTWVFWGTGDKENPTLTNTVDSFFAIKDDNRTGSYAIGNLQNITDSTFSGSLPGWYITLPTGEKALSDSSAFGGMVTWTTYIPYTGTDDCKRAGTAKLYAVAMMRLKIDGAYYEVGAGLFTSPHTRFLNLGDLNAAGIAQMPVFSQKPGGAAPTDVFISTGGGATGGVAQDSFIVTSAILGDSPFKKRLQDTAPSAQVIHWRDQRMQ